METGLGMMLLRRQSDALVRFLGGSAIKISAIDADGIDYRLLRVEVRRREGRSIRYEYTYTGPPWVTCYILETEIDEDRPWHIIAYDRLEPMMR